MRDIGINDFIGYACCGGSGSFLIETFYDPSSVFLSRPTIVECAGMHDWFLSLIHSVETCCSSHILLFERSGVEGNHF